MKKVLFPILALVLALGLALPMATGASPGPGIVGLWHLDEESGTTASDSSGSIPPNDGTISGATWAGSANAKFGDALSFDGTDDYVDFGSDVSLQLTDEFTIELWVNRTDKITFERFLSHSIDASTYAYEVGVDYANPDEWRLRLNSDAATLTVAMTGDAGEWIHVAFVYDKSLASANMKIYENGTLVASGDYNTSLTNHGSLQTNRQGKTDGWLNSTIDEVRIWDEALTAEQIEASFNGGIRKEWLGVDDPENAEASLGDHIGVHLDVIVSSTPMTVVDTLPPELRLRVDGPSTFRVDGDPATPVLDGNTVSYTFTQLGAHTIDMKIQVVEVQYEDVTVINEAKLYDNGDEVASHSANITLHPYEWFVKEVLWCEIDEEPVPWDEVPIETDVHWFVLLGVGNMPGDDIDTMEDVVVKDRLGGDLELDASNTTAWVDGNWTGGGNITIPKVSGRTEKLHLAWTEIPNFEDDDYALALLEISTDMNPGRGSKHTPWKPGKQEYTEAGEHDLNSGAVLKFTDPETGFQLSAHTPPITVVAFVPEE